MEGPVIVSLNLSYPNCKQVSSALYPNHEAQNGHCIRSSSGIGVTDNVLETHHIPKLALTIPLHAVESSSLSNHAGTVKQIANLIHNRNSPSRCHVVYSCVAPALCLHPDSASTFLQCNDMITTNPQHRRRKDFRSLTKQYRIFRLHKELTCDNKAIFYR